jgi:hypothetical protein
MVAFHDWLFDESLYKQEAALFRLDPGVAQRASAGLDRLKEAWSSKRLRRAGKDIRITEMKAQQAFNQLVFQDILGYEGLMGSGSTYTVLPEVSFTTSLKDGRNVRLRPDLSIGEFAWSASSVKAVTELKSPGADLMKAQTGKSYYSEVSGGQVSAVQQAIEAMAAAGCAWALVSNMHLVCLIHRSALDHALACNLMTLDTDGLRTFFFAFGPGGFYSMNARQPRLQLVHDRAKRLIR